MNQVIIVRGRNCGKTHFQNLLNQILELPEMEVKAMIAVLEAAIESKVKNKKSVKP